MLKFRCQACGHKIGISEQYAGKKGKCPKCQSINVVPLANRSTAKNQIEENDQLLKEAIERRALESVPSSNNVKDVASYVKTSPSTNQYSVQEETKQCPFCEETILKKARKCKHCGEFLDGRENIASSPRAFVRQEVLYENTARQHNNYQEFSNQGVLPPLPGAAVSNTIIWVLAFAPLIGIFLEGFISVLTGIPQEYLWFITLVLNIILSYADEKKLKDTGHDTSNMGASWLVPVYLFKRAKILKHNYAYFIVWCVLFGLLLIL